MKFNKHQYCSAITCDVPEMSGATTNCEASAAFGSTCDMICNDGYVINGSATITCGDDNNDGVGDYDNQSTCESKCLLMYYQVYTFNIITN